MRSRRLELQDVAQHTTKNTFLCALCCMPVFKGSPAVLLTHTHKNTVYPGDLSFLEKENSFVFTHLCTDCGEMDNV